jgi:hypothetical protein
MLFLPLRRVLPDAFLRHAAAAATVTLVWIWIGRGDPILRRDTETGPRCRGGANDVAAKECVRKLEEKLLYGSFGARDESRNAASSNRGSGEACSEGWSTTKRLMSAPTEKPTLRLIAVAAATWRCSILLEVEIVDSVKRECGGEYWRGC